MHHTIFTFLLIGLYYTSLHIKTVIATQSIYSCNGLNHNLDGVHWNDSYNLSASLESVYWSNYTPEHPIVSTVGVFIPPRCLDGRDIIKITSIQSIEAVLDITIPSTIPEINIDSRSSDLKFVISLYNGVSNPTLVVLTRIIGLSMCQIKDLVTNNIVTKLTANSNKALRIKCDTSQVIAESKTVPDDPLDLTLSPDIPIVLSISAHFTDPKMAPPNGASVSIRRIPLTFNEGFVDTVWKPQSVNGWELKQDILMATSIVFTAVTNQSPPPPPVPVDIPHPIPIYPPPIEPPLAEEPYSPPITEPPIEPPLAEEPYSTPIESPVTPIIEEAPIESPVPPVVGESPILEPIQEQPMPEDHPTEEPLSNEQPIEPSPATNTSPNEEPISQPISVPISEPIQEPVDIPVSVNNPINNSPPIGIEPQPEESPIFVPIVDEPLSPAPIFQNNPTQSPTLSSNPVSVDEVPSNSPVDNSVSSFDKLSNENKNVVISVLIIGSLLVISFIIIVVYLIKRRIRANTLKTWKKMHDDENNPTTTIHGITVNKSTTTITSDTTKEGKGNLKTIDLIVENALALSTYKRKNRNKEPILVYDNKKSIAVGYTPSSEKSNNRAFPTPNKKTEKSLPQPKMPVPNDTTTSDPSQSEMELLQAVSEKYFDDAVDDVRHTESSTENDSLLISSIDNNKELLTDNDTCDIEKEEKILDNKVYHRINLDELMKEIGIESK